MQVRLGSLAPWLTHDTQVTDQSLQHATHAVQSETRHILQSLKGIHSEHDMKRISKKVTQKIWDDALYGTASRPYGMIHYD